MTMIKLLLIAIFFTLTAQQIRSQALVNPNASPQAKRLKALLDSVYGKKIISGQCDESYLQYIKDNTGGKMPALMGYDFNGITPSGGGNADAFKAVKWARQGGIVQFQWHWASPNGGGSSNWNANDFDLKAALADPNSSSYKNMMRDIDLVGAALKTLQDSGVAVLWRPLHEAEGAWFWWGGSGKESCQALWKLMYNHYVNDLKLNNLIWVWNSYAPSKANWYPGDDVVDIIAFDYPDYSASGSWSGYQSLFGNSKKLFGIGEDGKLTDPNVLSTQGWLYFMTWAYMAKDPSQKDGKNPKDWLYQVYNDSRVITLDDLIPGPKAYAGNSQMLFDMDGDGKETVSLDGSRSYVAGGTIDAYSWSENGTVLSTEAKPQLSLAIGVHIIKLTITTNSKETKTGTVVITIKTPSICLKKPVSVSSTENGYGNTADKGVDGDGATRWSSEYSDPQWYMVNLGKKYNIKKVIITWENASAKSYTIEESNDGYTWTTVANRQNMANGARIDTIANLKGGAQYIRIYGTGRTTNYGYSFYEFEAYGDENPNAIPGSDAPTAIVSESLTKIRIYPTLLSSSDTLTIISPSEMKDGKLFIYDAIGRLSLTKEINGNTSEISLGDRFAKGIYTVKLTSSLGEHTNKIVIQ